MRSLRALGLQPGQVQVLLSCWTGAGHMRLRFVPALLSLFHLQTAHFYSGASAATEGRRHQAHAEARRVPAAHVGQSLQAHAGVTHGATGRHAHDEVVVQQVLRALRAHDGLQQARQQLGNIAKDARTALGPLPLNSATSALFSLCDAVVDRSA